MPEYYPADDELLSRAGDEHTGLEYIATGKTPYYLEFRRLVHRLATAAARSGDLRPFQDGPLTIGVKPGRCVVGGQRITYAGDAEVPVASVGTTRVYLDAAGVLQTTTDLFPDDPSMFVPIAEVAVEDGSITELADLRGETFLRSPGARDGIWMRGVIEGDLTADVGGALVDAAPVAGTITDVILTLGENIVSSNSSDGVAAYVTVNGTSICSAPAKIVDGDGSGRRSTAAGDGMPPALETLLATVDAGDIVRCDIDLIDQGTVLVHPHDVIVSVRLLPD
jgi:hypothetical protein